MANPLLMSSASSAMVSVLNQVDTNVHASPFAYRYAQDLKGSSFSACAKQFLEIQPNGSKVLGGIIDFPITKNGLLAGLIVKMTLNKTATFGINNSIGALQIEEMQLVTNGRVLFSQTAEGLLSLIANMPYQSRKTLEDMLLLQSGGDGTVNPGSTTSNIHYVPALFSCFESMEGFLNCNFSEPLTLRLRMASANTYCATDVDSDATQNITLGDITLIAQYVQLPANVEQSLIQHNFGSGENLSTINWDLIHEFTDGTLSAGSSSTITHEVKTNRLVNEAYIVLTSGLGDHSNVIDNVGMGLELDTIKIESNGQVIAELDAKVVGSLAGESFDDWGYSESSYYDRSSRADGTNYRYKFNFGLTKDTRRVFGAVSTRELNSFRFVVTTANAGATQTAGRLHVIFKSPMLISHSAESGRITSSISS